MRKIQMTIGCRMGQEDEALETALRLYEQWEKREHPDLAEEFEVYITPWD